MIKTTDRSEDMKARPCPMSITSTDGRPEASVVSPSAGTRKMAGRWQARERETQAEWPSSEAGQKHHRDKTKSTRPRVNLNLSDVIGEEGQT